jgi:hypothetical protein
MFSVYFTLSTVEHRVEINVKCRKTKDMHKWNHMKTLMSKNSYDILILF